MDDVFCVIENISALSPSPAARYRIHRLLGQPVQPELLDAFCRSKWVELLKAGQREDGGFGRFHSMDSKVKQLYPTTERALDAMRILGLSRGCPLVDRVCAYMEGIITGDIPWPDVLEKNPWYRSAIGLFAASKLSAFGSDSEAFLKVFDLWHAVLREAFADGTYSRDRANRVSKELLGCDIDGRYIALNSIYAVELFAHMESRLDEDLKRRYLKWLHGLEIPVFYTSAVLSRGLDNRFSDLYRVYFPLSEFSCFREEFGEELRLLKERRDPNGFWNFGRSFNVQKLSDDWRSRARMTTDHTVLALVLYA